MSNPSLDKALRTSGYSSTKPRRIVFRAVQEHGPISINQLIHTTSKQIDRASVYRTVTLYEKLGFVRRVNVGWKYKLELSDIFTHHHHHIICRYCGRSEDLRDDKQLSAVINAMSLKTGYQELSHEIEVIGVCPNCVKKGTPSQAQGSRKPHTSS